jgi:hypothetical protein
MVLLSLMRKRSTVCGVAILLVAAVVFCVVDAKPLDRSSGDARLAMLQIFPPTDPWNTDISNQPVDPNSAAILKRIGLNKPLHPDFGAPYNGKPNGIPYVVVSGDQKKVPVTFEYKDESDPGPYPIPPDAPIEGGQDAKDGDRHVLVIDADHSKLYEMWASVRHEDGASWSAGSGAVFDLKTGKLRPAGWTSADAAGLPIFPGLVRYDEVIHRKAIHHALRFTVTKTRRAYVAPARHFAARATDTDLPPMGMRVRLKASFNIDVYPPASKVILQALKTYGMILADNGGDWFLSGAPDDQWDDEDLGHLKHVKVADFEVLKP